MEKSIPNRQPAERVLLVDHGQALAEEAVGFGVPVLKSGLQTIFPAATLSWEQSDGIWEISRAFQVKSG